MTLLACLMPWLGGWKSVLNRTFFSTQYSLRASPCDLTSVVTWDGGNSYDHSGLQQRGLQETGNGSCQSLKIWTQNTQVHFCHVYWPSQMQREGSAAQPLDGSRVKGFEAILTSPHILISMQISKEVGRVCRFPSLS